MSDASAFRLDPSAVCEACGCLGAYRFDGEALCADCYAGRGSCCSAEFSGRGPDTGDETDRLAAAEPVSASLPIPVKGPPAPPDRQGG